MSPDKIRSFFGGRKLIIATKHKKEQIIAPLLSETLHVECCIDERLDTDILGTFTGEIDRKQDVLETARRKCLMAMELTGCDMALASEGSFGPHPTIGFINADDEILMFIDQKNNLEIIVRELSLKTNFNGQAINSEEELLDFSNMVQFPSHGLILRKSALDHTHIVKGLTDKEKLNYFFRQFKNKYGSAYAETDMRAMYNPTRMEVIKSAAKKLAEKITSLCPECNTPGFGVTQAKPGLPCSLCGFPTKSTLAHEYQCLKCTYKEERKYPNKKTSEEPTFCDICNP